MAKYKNSTKEDPIKISNKTAGAGDHRLYEFRQIPGISQSHVTVPYLQLQQFYLDRHAEAGRHSSGRIFHMEK